MTLALVAMGFVLFEGFGPYLEPYLGVGDWASVAVVAFLIVSPLWVGLMMWASSRGKAHYRVWHEVELGRVVAFDADLVRALGQDLERVRVRVEPSSQVMAVTQDRTFLWFNAYGILVISLDRVDQTGLAFVVSQAAVEMVYATAKGIGRKAAMSVTANVIASGVQGAATGVFGPVVESATTTVIEQVASLASHDGLVGSAVEYVGGAVTSVLDVTTALPSVTSIALRLAGRVAVRYSVAQIKQFWCNRREMAELEAAVKGCSLDALVLHPGATFYGWKEVYSFHMNRSLIRTTCTLGTTSAWVKFKTYTPARFRELCESFGLQMPATPRKHPALARRVHGALESSGPKPFALNAPPSPPLRVFLPQIATTTLIGLALAVGLSLLPQLEGLSKGTVQPPSLDFAEGLPPSGADATAQPESVVLASEAPPVPPPIPESFRQASAFYLKAMIWYNQRDQRFFGVYSDKVDCYYNAANFSRRAIQRQRARDFRRLDTSVAVDDLWLVAANDDEVLFRDVGRWSKGGGETTYHKVIVMRRAGNSWKITTEVGKSAHACYPHFDRVADGEAR